MNDTEVITVLQRYEDHWTSERLHESIALLQTNGILTIPDLLTALADTDPNIRLLVIEILFELAPLEASLPTLIKALEDPDRIIRIAAVEPVARFGKGAIEAGPILVVAVRREERTCQLSPYSKKSMIQSTQPSQCVCSSTPPTSG